MFLRAFTFAIVGALVLSYSATAQQASGAYQFRPSQNAKVQNKVRKATAAMKKAESSVDRADAKEKLKTALGEDYDLRLKDYEKFLDKMEKQLVEMREKLDRKRAAKTAMIELRMQVLEAEADDLGWPSQLNANRPSFNTAFPQFQNQNGNLDPFAQNQRAVIRWEPAQVQETITELIEDDGN